MRWIMLLYLGCIVETQQCTCGLGGLCQGNSNAVPCSCDVVSKGIYEPADSHCNQLVDYCPAFRCVHGKCISAYGSYTCSCESNWQGHNCDQLSNTPSKTSIISLWYPTRQKTWDVVVAAAMISNETQIVFSFEQGHIWTTKINYCDEATYAEVQHSVIRRLLKSAKYLFKCHVVIGHVNWNNVTIEGLVGPVGHFHQVQVAVVDEVVQHNATYHVFLETTDLEKNCGFSLMFTGCSESTSPIEHYGLFTKFRVSVSVVLQNECLYRTVSYDWSLAPTANTELLQKVGTGKTIATTASSFGLLGLVTFQVNITFEDIIGLISREAVVAMCYVSIENEDFNVSVSGFDKVHSCGSTVTLVSNVNVDVSPGELRYQWTSSLGQGTDETLLLKNGQCGSYAVALIVTHVPTNKTATISGNVSFQTHPRNVVVTCSPLCYRANPASSYTIVATKDFSLKELVWEYPPELNHTIRDFRSPKNIFLIKPNSLNFGARYSFKVKVEGVSRDFEIVTNTELHLECSISPKDGSPTRTKFQITCHPDVADTTVYYAVVQGSERDLVRLSTSSVMLNLEITDTPVYINISDATGSRGSTELHLNLVIPSQSDLDELKTEIEERVANLKWLVKAKHWAGVANEVDIITKKELFLNLFIQSPELTYRLMSFLWEMDPCCWLETLIKVANSVRRLASFDIFSEEGDLFLVKAGIVLVRLTRNLDYVMATAGGVLSMNPLFEAIHLAARASISAVDSYQFNPLLGEDIRRIHLRRSQLGNIYMRKALENVGFFIARNIPRPSPPFQILSDVPEETMVVISNHPAFINVCAYPDDDDSYFQLPAETMRTLIASNAFVATTIINFKGENFWWDTEISASGEMFEVHVYQYDRRGWSTLHHLPVDIYIRLSKQLSETYHGELIHPEIRLDDAQMDEYVDVYYIHIEQGHGTISMAFDKGGQGQVHTFFTTSFMPDYSSIVSQPVLTSKVTQHKYIHTNSSGHVYFGLVAAKGIVPYRFNVSFFQCQTWDSVWTSDCVYFKVSKDMVSCKCPHSSLFRVNMFLPVHGVAHHLDIFFITQGRKNQWTIVVVIVVTSVLLALFVYAVWADRGTVSRATPEFLDDNYPGDNVPYLVAVYTGDRCMGGTSSRVALRIIGTSATSRVHIITKYRDFEQAMDDWYILYTRTDLGYLEKVQLWHDCSGASPDWYCGAVVIYDSYTKATFPIDSWLYTDIYASGNTSITALRNEPTTEWTSYIGKQFMAITRDSDLIISIFYLHPRSIYTRPERVMVTAVVVYITLWTSLMFLQGGIIDASSIRFTREDLISSLYTLFIPSIVTMTTAYLFSQGNEEVIKELRMRQSQSMKETIVALFLEPVILLPVMLPKKVKKKKKINMWTLTAWLASIAACGATIGLIMHYGENVGDNKMWIWVVMFLFRMVTEILIVSTMLSFLYAVAIAYILRGTVQRVDVVRVDLAESAKMTIHTSDYNHRLSIAFNDRRKPMYKPPLMSHLKLKKELESKSHVSVGINIFFLSLLSTGILFLVYYLHLYLDYYSFREIREVNLDIPNHAQFFGFLREVIQNFHRVVWYNGKEISPMNRKDFSKHEIDYAFNYVSKVIGVLSLRQKRVSPTFKAPVHPLFRRWFPRAFPHLSLINEDRVTRLTNWKNAPENGVHPKTIFYTSIFDSDMGFYIGATRFCFDNGGYVKNLHWSTSSANQTVIDLMYDNWVDDATRVIITSFNLYNANVDLVTSVVLVTETLPNGVFVSRTIIDATPINFLQPQFQNVFWSLIFLLVTALFHIGFSIALVWKNGIGNYLSYQLGKTGLILILSGITFNSYFIFYFTQFPTVMDRVQNSPRDVYTPLDEFLFYKTISLLSTGLFSVCVATTYAKNVSRLFNFQVLRRAMLLKQQSLTGLSAMTIAIIVYIVSHIDLLTTTDEQMWNIVFHAFFKEITKEDVTTPAGPLLTTPLTFVLSFTVIKLNGAALIMYFERSSEAHRLHRLAMREAGSQDVTIPLNKRRELIKIYDRYRQVSWESTKLKDSWSSSTSRST